MNATTVYDRMLGSSTDAILRSVAINFAIVGFLLHLLCCFLYDFNVIESDDSFVFDSYLDALYTPFSIILAYEVYELIRAIPESFSNSIGKQFEVVTLLVVRDIFKNLADLGGADNVIIDADVAFIAIEAVAFIVLFGTALYFRAQTSDSKVLRHEDASLQAFVQQKKHLACALVIVYILVALYSFTTWLTGVVDGDTGLSRTVFFSDFFTWLIVSDIVILLVSYKHITDFPQLARNTGFILSTVIIRVGIGIPGFTGAILFILSAALASCVLRLSLHSNQGLESEE